MIIAVAPSFTDGTGVPLVGNLYVTSGQTGIIIGSLLALTSGKLVLASTGPTTGIVGVALQGYQTAPGNNQMNSPNPTTGTIDKISFARARSNTTFVSKFTNTTATYIAPAVTDIGVSYGMTLQSNGIWTVDKNITGASACVTITDVDIDNLLVYWKFISTAVV